MSIVQETRVVNGSIEKAWAAISKMGAVEEWHPNVAKVEVLTEHDSGIGASRRVTFHDGNGSVETVVKESEQKFSTVEMTEMQMMKNAFITISIKEISDEKTEVTFLIDYGTTMGPIGWLMARLMMNRILRKVFVIALAGLSYHLETGERVTDSVPGHEAK